MLFKTEELIPPAAGNVSCRQLTAVSFSRNFHEWKQLYVKLHLLPTSIPHSMTSRHGVLVQRGAKARLPCANLGHLWIVIPSWNFMWDQPQGTVTAVKPRFSSCPILLPLLTPSSTPRVLTASSSSVSQSFRASILGTWEMSVGILGSIFWSWQSRVWLARKTLPLVMTMDSPTHAVQNSSSCDLGRDTSVGECIGRCDLSFER